MHDPFSFAKLMFSLLAPFYGHSRKVRDLEDRNAALEEKNKTLELTNAALQQRAEDMRFVCGMLLCMVLVLVVAHAMRTSA
jgi:hypothetical protein